MTTDAIMESLGAAQAKITAAKEKLKAEFVPFIQPFFEALFAEHPEVALLEEGLKVHGYTPGFNDGDPCVHTQSTNLDDLYGPLGGEKDYKAYSAKVRPIENKIDALQSVLEDAFGSGWEITVHQVDGKVTVSEPEEYDCGY